MRLILLLLPLALMLIPNPGEATKPPAAVATPGSINLGDPVAVAVSGPIMYVCDAETNSILMISTTGNAVSTRVQGGFGHRPGQFDLPGSIASGHGVIDVADIRNHRVQVFSPSGALKRVLRRPALPSWWYTNPALAPFLMRVATDKHGNPYVFEGSMTLTKYSSTGRRLWQVPVGVPRSEQYGGYPVAYSPLALAVSPDGAIARRGTGVWSWTVQPAVRHRHQCRRSDRGSRSRQPLTPDIVRQRETALLLGSLLSVFKQKGSLEASMTDSDLDPVRFGTTFKAFMDAVVAAAKPPTSPLLERIEAHLGTDLSHLAVIAEAYDDFDHPNVQRALDAYMAQGGRRATLVGIGASNKRFMSLGLSDLLNMGDGPAGRALGEGAVDYANFHLADDEVLSCVDLGLYFIHDGDTPLLALITGVTEHGPRQKVSLEVVARRPEEAQAFLAEITATMDRLNVYRGHVIALSPGEFGPGRQMLIAFPRLPRVTRGDVILPAGLLDRIERHTIVFSEQAERLRAAGRSLKRGLLLYGPPGVGKTLTVEYLANRMPGRTVILTAGMNMGLLQPAVHLARKLAPAMVVLEDVDLIAEERGMPFGHSGPLLFSLLNEMDGLQEDSDVIFVLTTNRPDILEPALAARPGRIDLAVEYPIPDTEARLQLLELYARGLDLRDVDLAEIAERIAGATPAYIKELLRKAAVVAAEGNEIVVTQAHLETALAELDAGGELAHRLLGFRAVGDAADRTNNYSPRPHGFPSGFPPDRVSME